jgi:hypothetical protein
MSDISAELSKKLLQKAHYVGSPKHKKNPIAFGLGPFSGERGDRTLCDEHAGFTPSRMADVPAMLRRGIEAGLIGKGEMLWAVCDSGWIYEARITNRDQSEYHGYPVRPLETIARKVFDRFEEWASSDPVRQQVLTTTLENCRNRYGFRR